MVLDIVLQCVVLSCIELPDVALRCKELGIQLLDGMAPQHELLESGIVLHQSGGDWYRADRPRSALH